MSVVFCVQGAGAKRQHVCFGSNFARLLGVALAPAISEFVQGSGTGAGGSRVSGIGGVGLPVASMMTMTMRFHDARRIARGATVATAGWWACAPPRYTRLWHDWAECEADGGRKRRWLALGGELLCWQGHLG